MGILPHSLEAIGSKTKLYVGFILSVWKRNKILVLVLVSVFIFAAIISGIMPVNDEHMPEVFVGVMLGHNDVNTILRFVDEVKDYVNLVIVSELEITRNATVLYIIFDYLHEQGLYFIPFQALFEFVDDPDFFQVARQRWGKHFLGVYTFDEPGGKQFDADHRPVTEAEDYNDAASKFVDAVAWEGLTSWAENFRAIGNLKIFTSDYALYWFDYASCYSVVLTQFGWNFSRQLHVALCRGAANAHNSDWGAIITWEYRQPPYIQGADELYQDMVLAYQNGAKYIVVFNFPTNQTEYGLLTRAHLDAMKQFWEYQKIISPPKEYVAEVAYVLPENYGFAFRRPDSRIWGLWNPDELSEGIWNDVMRLLSLYGSKLDIIYVTADPSIRQQYNRLIFWNGTISDQTGG